MKQLKSLTFLATLAIAIGMISWGSALHAQQTPSGSQQAPQTQQPPQPEMPPSSQQTPQTQSPSQQPPDTTAPPSQSQGAAAGATSTGDSQTFSGTVVKQGDKYMLKDDSGKMYDIDHQTEVAKFDGKRVRVQGTLDPSGKKIMVK